MWSWGFGKYGELGNGTGDGQTLSFSRVPVRVSNLSHVTAIASGTGTGATTAHALTAHNGLWAWGYGYDGELGNNTTPLSSAVPVKVRNLPAIATIAAGNYNAYALS